MHSLANPKGVSSSVLSHSGSVFREGLQDGPAARYVLFSLIADSSSIGVTLTGLRERNYTAPADKYTPEMKAALAPELLPMLEWELDDDTDGEGLLGLGAENAKL